LSRCHRCKVHDHDPTVCNQQSNLKQTLSAIRIDPVLYSKMIDEITESLQEKPSTQLMTPPGFLLRVPTTPTPFWCTQRSFR
jgi:hypothetical protein